MYEISSESPGV